MEELWNAITHGIGAVLALAGLVVLVVSASFYGNVWHIVSFSIYGATLLLLYLASTLYHSFQKEKVKYVFKIIDHSAIYLFIAGTYTPFTLVLLHGVWGWSIFATIWALAVAGIVFKIFFVKKFKILSTLCYVGMGWFVLIAVKPLIASLPTVGLYWLVLGGLFYTVGTVFYLWRRLPYHHTVWHLFVMAGSAAHFIVVLLYVLPVPVAA
ncbi:hly-iii [Lucifera butyrica]|uniref:Hly-iii n=1 Tax=Lucifera butyrica TaxID=1351585 RepID=A0A498R1D3_9FIRM|nr:hemolysin III family protein [Lucifera butyrica]VBB05151.1 hly-iii [Lucifera butyrica]